MFHNNLKAQRLNCGLSQRQVADFLCVSPQSVSKWEKGESLPSIEFLPRLAECFNSDINSFFVKGEIKTDYCGIIFTLFEVMTDVLDETKQFEVVTELISENMEAVDTAVTVCNDLLEHKTVNVRSIREMLNCNDTKARTFLGYLERCEMIERLDVADFYYVIKDAVEGFILLLKMRKQVCEVINKLEKNNAK